MAKGYSTDLRDRVVALVEGGESCREAARLLDLAASTSRTSMRRDSLPLSAHHFETTHFMSRARNLL